MTMQVGMVGSDGVLIASDTQWTNNPQLRVGQLWAGGRHSYNAPKILVSHEHRMAVSSARSMETAGEIAHKLIAELTDGDFPYPMRKVEQIADGVLAAARQDRTDAQCLIGSVRPSPQLFLFQFGMINKEYGSICQCMESLAFAGDNLNAAIFWAERYYPRRPRLPIRQLIPLAAHLVVCAERLNSAMISGLEIVLCDSSGIHRLSDASIEELESTARERDKSIGESLLNGSQQFSYAPNVAG